MSSHGISAILFYSKSFHEVFKSHGFAPHKFFFCAAAAAKSFNHVQTLCDPVDGSPPGSSVPGILQARILEWVAIPFSFFSANN